MPEMWLNFDGVIMRNKIILILIFSICFSLCLSCRYRSEIPFEREKWQGEHSPHTNDINRPGMARNLVNQKLLIGKTREEIREILGKPEPMPEGTQNQIIHYTLEEEYWIIDPVFIEWLEITFNQENNVEKAEIKSRKIG